ncbi:hypothetical protein [Globicatella sulfidifaciens]|uniref:DUF3990 domain-containing protein n=1 Tax=Globicatella sulfidifaciens TaxID=136093 RepID=A0A7X8C3M6_9LACT|nr:hypothetical protein [Globicatella sulfidifaciens]NLJ18363.1 hypothetical protein [Globicatella sulfidifaciens]
MNKDEIQLCGYHGTLSNSAEKIIKDGFKIKEYTPNDGKYCHNHWLGHGIYFYEDYDLAKQWADSKSIAFAKKHNLKSESTVIFASYKSNEKNICNLDNSNQLRKFNNYAKDVEKLIANERYYCLDFTKNIKPELSAEEKEQEIIKRIRCFAFDCFKSEKNIQIIMYTFSMRNHVKYTDIALGVNQKQICVSSPNCITELRLEEGG